MGLKQRVACIKTHLTVYRMCHILVIDCAHHVALCFSNSGPPSLILMGPSGLCRDPVIFEDDCVLYNFALINAPLADIPDMFILVMWIPLLLF